MSESPLPSIGALPVDLEPTIETPLDDLRKAHLEFLDVLRRTSASVGAGHLLYPVLLGHVRLTQQFLDAQRSLLTRFGEYGAAALSIAGEAERDAKQMLSGATEHLRRSGHAPTEEERQILDDLVQPVAPSDAEAVEARLRGQQRELLMLLETWWAAEIEHGVDAVQRADEAAVHLRQRVTERVQELVARSVTEPSADLQRAEPPAPQGVPVGDDVLSTLDPTDLRQVDAVLDGLIGDMLRPASAVPTRPSRTRSSVEPALHAASRPAERREMAWPEFGEMSIWGPDVAIGTSSPLLTRVFLPLVAVLTVIAGLMAWTG